MAFYFKTTALVVSGALFLDAIGPVSAQGQCVGTAISVPQEIRWQAVVQPGGTATRPAVDKTPIRYIRAIIPAIVTVGLIITEGSAHAQTPPARPPVGSTQDLLADLTKPTRRGGAADALLVQASQRTALQDQLLARLASDQAHEASAEDKQSREFRQNLIVRVLQESWAPDAMWRVGMGPYSIETRRLILKWLAQWISAQQDVKNPSENILDDLLGLAYSRLSSEALTLVRVLDEKDPTEELFWKVVAHADRAATVGNNAAGKALDRLLGDIVPETAEDFVSLIVAENNLLKPALLRWVERTGSIQRLIGNNEQVDSSLASTLRDYAKRPELQDMALSLLGKLPQEKHNYFALLLQLRRAARATGNTQRADSIEALLQTDVEKPGGPQVLLEVAADASDYVNSRDAALLLAKWKDRFFGFPRNLEEAVDLSKNLLVLWNDPNKAEVADKLTPLFLAWLKGTEEERTIEAARNGSAERRRAQEQELASLRAAVVDFQKAKPGDPETENTAKIAALLKGNYGLLLQLLETEKNSSVQLALVKTLSGARSVRQLQRDLDNVGVFIDAINGKSPFQDAEIQQLAVFALSRGETDETLSQAVTRSLVKAKARGLTAPVAYSLEGQAATPNNAIAPVVTTDALDEMLRKASASDLLSAYISGTNAERVIVLPFLLARSDIESAFVDNPLTIDELVKDLSSPELGPGAGNLLARGKDRVLKKLIIERIILLAPGSLQGPNSAALFSGLLGLVDDPQAFDAAAKLLLATNATQATFNNRALAGIQEATEDPSRATLAQNIVQRFSIRLNPLPFSLKSHLGWGLGWVGLGILSALPWFVGVGTPGREVVTATGLAVVGVAVIGVWGLPTLWGGMVATGAYLFRPRRATQIDPSWEQWVRDRLETPEVGGRVNFVDEAPPAAGWLMWTAADRSVVSVPHWWVAQSPSIVFRLFRSLALPLVVAHEERRLKNQSTRRIYVAKNLGGLMIDYSRGVAPNAISATVAIVLWLLSSGWHVWLLSRHPTSIAMDAAWLGLTFFLPVVPLWILVGALAKFFASEQTFMTNSNALIGRLAKTEPASPLPWNTIQATVHDEDFENVIVPMLQRALREQAAYRGLGGECNIVVFDDSLLAVPEQRDKRIAFYRAHGIAFVGRPKAPRAGSFPKASNVNHGLELAVRFERFAADDQAPGLTRETVMERFQNHELVETHRWIAEGDIRWGTLVTALDKDSKMPNEVLPRAAQLFNENPRLAFAQFKSLPTNDDETFFSALTRQIGRTLFGLIAPGEASAGGHVLHAGHNVVMRREAMEAVARRRPNGTIQYWDEDQATEDLAFQMRVMAAGWEGVYVADPETAFGEKISRTYSEEASRYRRFGFGAFNIALNPLRDWLRHGPFHPIWLSYWRSPYVSWHRKFASFIVVLNYFAGVNVVALMLFVLASIWTTGAVPYSARFGLTTVGINVVISSVIVPLAQLRLYARLRTLPQYHGEVGTIRQELMAHLRAEWQAFFFFNSHQLRWTVGLIYHMFGISKRFGATRVEQLQDLPLMNVVGSILKEDGASIGVGLVLLGFSLRSVERMAEPYWYLGVFGPILVMLVSHVVAPFILNPLFIRKVFPPTRWSSRGKPFVLSAVLAAA